MGGRSHRAQELRVRVTPPRAEIRALSRKPEKGGSELCPEASFRGCRALAEACPEQPATAGGRGEGASPERLAWMSHLRPGSPPGALQGVPSRPHRQLTSLGPIPGLTMAVTEARAGATRPRPGPGARAGRRKTLCVTRGEGTEEAGPSQVKGRSSPVWLLGHRVRRPWELVTRAALGSTPGPLPLTLMGESRRSAYEGP